MPGNKVEPAKILVVDDEKTTRLALCEAFNQVGYQADHAGSGHDALSELATSHYDVVILDLQMPGMSGVQVLKEVEQMAPNTAFVVFTAHASTDTAIAALRSGAVDYLRKPVSLERLFAVVERAVKKQRQQKQQREAVQLLRQAMQALQLPMGDDEEEETAVLQVADILINKQTQSAHYQGEPLPLTPVEYKLLHHLVCCPDTVLSYVELARVSHGMDIEETEARTLLRTHLYRLSQKLGGKEQSPLQAVRGRGVILYTTLPETDDPVR
ncbi:MAG: response regulator transcription factor [Ardenticatenaceae bacterium]|nr:response regulator transcription factor [Ardenticatenaceae bacterium]MCB9004701.1 response regulator transcription factor [Ardenticatenaceae bacterium]